jgi:hypothetical protein
MKKNRKKSEFLDHLRKIPIVLVACEKSGLSRNSVYRWRKEDKEFQKEMDEALIEGEEMVNDMSESQLLTMIKEKNWSAVSFWLRHRNPKFKDKLEVTTKSEFQEELTPEQEAIVREALSLANSRQIISTKEDENGEQKHDTGGTG